jgi:prepilin-type N-terminal cleavage/methylation domain-containing protein
MKNSFIKKTLAFSLIELSIVILIVGILIAGVTQGSRLVKESKLKTAISITSSSDVNSIPDLVMWLDATNEENLKTSAFSDIATTNYGNIEDDDPISAWKDGNLTNVDK